MRLLLLAIPLFTVALTPQRSLAQSREDTYRNCSLNMVFKQGERTISTQPLGIDGQVRYDPAFRRYVIAYENDAGQMEIFGLRYIQPAPGGNTRYYDDRENVWIVWDRLRDIGGMRLTPENRTMNGMDGSILVSCSR